MKKVIKLKESELIGIIKRIISEGDENYNDVGAEYNTEKGRLTGNYQYKNFPSPEKVTEYLKWFNGGTYPEIQKYLASNYGWRARYSDDALNRKGSVEQNQFKTFLNVVSGLLDVAAKLNYNGKKFLSLYKLEDLNTHLGGRFAIKDWENLFSTKMDTPLGKPKDLKAFAAKVIDARRKSVGV
jgi:hypothetical protein